MNKNPLDIIVKASQSLCDSAKDTVTTNIMTAIRTGQVKVETSEVQKLLMIVGASIEEGHSRASRAFSRTVNEALDVAALPDLKKRK